MTPTSQSARRPTRVLGHPPRILIVGGGYVGLYTARHLQRKLRRDEAVVTVVDPQPVMTYQPFLAEVAAGSIEARHVAVPLRKTLSRCEVLTGSVTAINHRSRWATVRPLEGSPYLLDYDILVLAAGSVARQLPIPGLAEHGMTFKTVGEALALRNHVLSRLDVAASTDDPELRRRALAFVVVGGGYSGVEVLAELEDMTRYATRYYPSIDAGELRWLLVETADRILPEVDLPLGQYTVRQLRRRGVEVRLGTTVRSMTDGRVALSDGTAVEAGTIVWTAGVAANPLLRRLGLGVDELGRVRCGADLRVLAADGVWAAGDGANVPDLHRGADATCAPTAQHAVRQARRLARNILADLRGAETKPYRHRDAGSVASLGLYKGVAQVYGLRVRGLLAWLMHRGYHLKAVPTWNRKVRVLADWTLSFLLRREVVGLAHGQPAVRHLAAVRDANPPVAAPVPSSEGSTPAAATGGWTA